MTNTTLDPKILNKNLEITRITKQLDDLTSDYVALKEQCREQTPMYMVNTLEECYTSIRNHSLGSKLLLATELRKVIKFLQQ